MLVLQDNFSSFTLQAMTHFNVAFLLKNFIINVTHMQITAQLVCIVQLYCMSQSKYPWNYSKVQIYNISTTHVPHMSLYLGHR